MHILGGETHSTAVRGEALSALCPSNKYRVLCRFVQSVAAAVVAVVAVHNVMIPRLVLIFDRSITEHPGN